MRFDSAAERRTALHGVLGGFDAVVAPSRPTVAWPIDKAFDKVYPDYPGGTNISGAANLCGVPGLFLMNGTGEGGLPTSLQLTGRRGERGRSPRDRRGVQHRTTDHRTHPPGL